MKKTILIPIFIILISTLSLQLVHSQTEVKDFKKNRISLGVMDMALGEVGLKYERIFANGQVGVYVPVNISYYDGSWYDYDSKFYSGLGLNFYPTGQGTWRYFCGLEFNVGYGTFYHSYENYVYDGIYGPYYYWNEKPYDGVYTRFLINNGLQYTPTKEFSVDLNFGLGFRNAFIDELTKDEKINPTGRLQLNLSYRF